jgi:arginyl-tRNA synthetase
MKKALRFDGETGPYLQYTYARCAALLRKWKNLEGSSIDRSLLTSEKAKQLLLHLWDFQNTITNAANKYQPYLVARHLLDLAQLFNSFYQSERVVDEDDLVWSNTRLMLVRAVQQVMGNGLELLGIETLDEM